jgi:hypothetical protein
MAQQERDYDKPSYVGHPIPTRQLRSNQAKEVVPVQVSKYGSRNQNAEQVNDANKEVSRFVVHALIS